MNEKSIKPAHPVVFWELASHNAAKSAEFFEKIFGWDSKLDPASGIFHVPTRQEDGTGINGGIFTLSKARLPFVAVYIPVDDIEAKVKEIEAAGGLIVTRPESFGGPYRVSLFNEPSGVTFALIEFTGAPEEKAQE